MGEIKSAWEIAMEKVDRLKELTPDELKKQTEERHVLIGHALADKYVEVLNLQQLKIELDKYGDDKRKILSRIVISRLVSAIELDNHERLQKIMEGVYYLKGKELPKEMDKEIRKLFLEYEQVEKKAREEMEGSAREMLLRLGISGSAVAWVNTEVVGEYEQLPVQLAHPFHERLEVLKQKLLANL